MTPPDTATELMLFARFFAHSIPLKRMQVESACQSAGFYAQTDSVLVELDEQDQLLSANSIYRAPI